MTGENEASKPLTRGQGLLERGLGLSFKNRELLRQALTHGSYVNEHPGESAGSNERMEFLGDAVIDLVVAQELYRRYPDLDEGRLTQLRSEVVRGETLAQVARRLGVGPQLLLGQGEASSGGEDRDSNLAGALEALMGAVLLDRGYRSARSCVLRILRPELRRIRSEGASQDPKSRLQELAHRQGLGSPKYEVLREEGLEQLRRFVVRVSVGGEPAGEGKGRRKVDAEAAAAEAALKRVP